MRPRDPNLGLVTFVVVAVTGIAAFGIWRERDSVHLPWIAAVIAVVWLLALVAVLYAVVSVPRRMRLLLRREDVVLRAPLRRDRVLRRDAATSVVIAPVRDPYRPERVWTTLVVRTASGRRFVRLTDGVWHHEDLVHLAGSWSVPFSAPQRHGPISWRELDREFPGVARLSERRPRLFSAMWSIVLFFAIIVGIVVGIELATM